MLVGGVCSYRGFSKKIKKKDNRARRDVTPPHYEADDTRERSSTVNLCVLISEKNAYAGGLNDIFEILNLSNLSKFLICYLIEINRK